LKWWRIYLGLFSMETLGLLVSNIIIGSQPGERVIFNLSLTRFIIVAGLEILWLFSIWAVWQSIKKQAAFQKLLLNDVFVLAVVFASFLALAGNLYLICFDFNKLGEFQQLYLNFKPFLVWGFIVSLQSWLFSMVWFGHLFTGSQETRDKGRSDDELLLVLGLFILVVVIKIIFVIPTAYGPVIQSDELRYFETAKFLYNGNFLIEDINHSPFLYPLMLSVAFAFKENAYEAIKILNILFSSSIVFPLFLIARKYFTKKETLLITVLACILPYHLLFPRMIMSENLYFAIFLWIVFFMLNEPKSQKLSWFWNFNTGISIGLLYMTRYITLSIIPALLCAWWLINPGTTKNLFQPGIHKLGKFCLLAAGILIGFSPWLISGLSAGIPVQQLLGFGITSKTTAGQLTIKNLIIWLSLYLSYFILMAAPVLPVFTKFFSIRKKNLSAEIKNWFILLGAIFLGFLTACVRHSWRAFYNSEMPTKIMGRYVLYFAPLFFISALLLMRQTPASRQGSLVRHIAHTFVVPFLLVTISYQFLLGNLFNLHDGDLINLLGSVDVGYFKYLGMNFFYFLLVIYAVFCCLSWNTQIPYLKTIHLLLIIEFYLAGIPAYFQDLQTYQDYQYLANKIIEIYQSGDYDIADSLRIYTPRSATDRDRALFFNTVLFLNKDYPNIISVENGNETILEQESTDVQPIVITRIEKSDTPSESGRIVINFNGASYAILF
jgi:hypothetical protein